MGHYVDGFIVPVPLKNLDAYKALARTAGEVWMEHGALAYWECAAEDVKPGKLTSFPQAVQLEADETVIFSWILYESREHRDSVNSKAMNDPRLAAMCNPEALPFDGKRLIWGGFAPFLQLSREEAVVT